MHVYTFFNNFWFDNSHGKWNMQDIKKVGLAIGLFTCVQNKVYIYMYKIRHIQVACVSVETGAFQFLSLIHI